MAKDGFLFSLLLYSSIFRLMENVPLVKSSQMYSIGSKHPKLFFSSRGDIVLRLHNLHYIFSPSLLDHAYNRASAVYRSTTSRELHM